MGIQYVPVALNLTGKDVVIIGAGNVGTQKVEDFLGSGARVKVISPQASEQVKELARAGAVELHMRKYQPGDTEGAFLVMVATDDRDANVAAYAEATGRGQLVNVCDDPPHCNFIFTAKIERGPLTLSIYSHGTSPALSKRVRRELEKVIGPEYEKMANLMAELRPHVAAIPGLTQSERQRIYERLVYSQILYLFAEGEDAQARALAEWIVAHMTPEKAAD